MRVLPFMMNNNRNLAKPQFVRNNDNMHVKKEAHKYTGVASSDLAYASMFDNEIAKDLKLMGLI